MFFADALTAPGEGAIVNWQTRTRSRKFMRNLHMETDTNNSYVRRTGTRDACCAREV